VPFLDKNGGSATLFAVDMRWLVPNFGRKGDTSVTKSSNHAPFWASGAFVQRKEDRRPRRGRGGEECPSWGAPNSHLPLPGVPMRIRVSVCGLCVCPPLCVSGEARPCGCSSARSTQSVTVMEEVEETGSEPDLTDERDSDSEDEVGSIPA